MAPALKLLKPAESARLSESVYASLVEAVVSGRLAPGTIISEVSIASRLRVSRTPVREAVRQLIKDGLVEQQANRRPVVCRFTGEDAEEIFEMRKILEAESAARAATRITRAELNRLKEMARGVGKSWGARDIVDRWADFDEAFHRAIAEASGSRRLAADIQRYRLLHRGINKTHTRPTDLKRAWEEHVRILEALDRRRPEEARQAMIDHIQEWQVFFKRKFS